MPLYEYKCPRCGRFEMIRRFSDPELASCPTCGAAVERLLSAPAIQFKGTGWYVTDYARKSSGGDGEGKSASQSDSTPAQSTSKDSAASGSSSTK